jgi:hypothetical protein
MKEIALVTMLTENGDDIVLDAYTNKDEAHDVVTDLVDQFGHHFYVQYVQLK